MTPERHRRVGKEPKVPHTPWGTQSSRQRMAYRRLAIRMRRMTSVDLSTDDKAQWNICWQTQKGPKVDQSLYIVH